MNRVTQRASAKAGHLRAGGLLGTFLLMQMCVLPAQEGPARGLTLLGHRLGESQAQALEPAAFRCTSTESASALLCAARQPKDFRMAQVIPDAVMLHFADDRLIAIEVRFQEAVFADVAAQLRASHGPSRDEPERLRGGMGGYFENAIHLWEQDGAVLRLEQYAAGINTSSVILAGTAQLPRLVSPKKVDPASGLKDL